MTPIYIPDFVPELEDRDIEDLWSSMPWVQRTEARQECFFNLKGTEYTYGRGQGVRTYVPQDIELIPELVEFAWHLVQKRYQCYFHACFINGYADQHQHLGWHADDAEMIDHTKPIVVVSFGAEREIWTKPITPTVSSGEVQQYRLGHGSLFEMPAGFQHTHLHRIPKHDRPCGKRISLTFRELK